MAGVSESTPSLLLQKSVGAVEADWAAAELVHFSNVLPAAFLVEPYEDGSQVQVAAAHGGRFGADVVEQAPCEAPLFGKPADAYPGAAGDFR